MAVEKNELARLTAKDGTHDFAHSASVAAGLMALERRYGFKVTEKEREVVVNNQINKTRCLEEDSLNDTYLACHQEMFRALNGLLCTSKLFSVKISSHLHDVVVIYVHKPWYSGLNI